MTGWFWFSFVLIIAGLILCWTMAIRALHSTFSENWEHGLFWAGVVSTTAGIIILMVIFFSYVNDYNKLKKERDSLMIQLNQCKNPSGSSGPGFFSRIGSKISGWFGRNSSVPAAGNSGEVNPFKVQEASS